MKSLTFLFIPLLFVLGSTRSFSQQQVLITMDESQTDHLKAYGVVFNHITDGYSVKWLLNYRGGSFITNTENDIVRKSRIRNVTVQIISQTDAASIIQEVEQAGVNMSVVN